MLEDFKCLEYGKYLLHELRLVLGKTEKDMDILYKEAKFALQALIKMLPKQQAKQEVSEVFLSP